MIKTVFLSRQLKSKKKNIPVQLLYIFRVSKSMKLLVIKEANNRYLEPIYKLEVPLPSMLYFHSTPFIWQL